MDIMLNELSYVSPAATRSDAIVHMALLLQTIRALTAVGVQRTLRTVRHLVSTGLAPGYLIAQWMNDDAVDREERRYFKTIAAKAPFLDDLLRSASETRMTEFDFRFRGQTAIGLAVAYLLDGPAVSFRTVEEFRVDPLLVALHSLGNDGNFSEGEVPVCNLHDPEQVANRRTWIASRIEAERGAQQAMTDGSQLWRNRLLRWSHLEFCPAVEGQVSILNGTEEYFRQVIRHLDLIEAAVNGWDHGRFPLKGVVWSYESQSTMNQPALASMRDFVFEDGVKRRCEPHTKMLGANMRIHFCPDLPSRKAFIGYIGGHLPI
jgi:hypothetical protein